MSCGEADERVIHDEEIVTIQILLDGSFAKFAESSPVPLDFNFGILCFVFGNASEQRGVTTGMIPGEPFQSNYHTKLLVFEKRLWLTQTAARLSASKMCSQNKSSSSRCFITSQASTTLPRPL